MTNWRALPPGVYPVDREYTATICLGATSDATIAAKMDPRHTLIRRPHAACDRPQQVGSRLIGPTFGFSYPCRSCSCNALNALVTRHGALQPPAPKPLPHHPALAAALARAYTYLESVYYESWWGKWSETKRKLFLRSMAYDAIRPDQIKAFVKFEGGHKMPTKARLIQGYSQLTTQELRAREFTTFQKALASVMDIDGYELEPGIWVTFASGYNGRDLGRWLTEAERAYVRPHYYERDGKNWDSTMQDTHHRCKVAHMRACSAELADFADKSYRVNGFWMGKNTCLKYVLDGTVKSGHNDTSSGNSLINAVLTAAAMRDCGLRGRVIVAGDDMLAVVDGDFDAIALANAERSYGIIPEARKFYAAEDVSFISGAFLRDSQTGSLAFFPVLGRLLARLWWTTKKIRPADLDNFRYSVACGLRDALAGMPVYGDLIAGPLTVGGVLVDTGKFKHQPHSVCVRGDFLDSLARRYGVSAQSLLDFGAFIRSAGCRPCYLVHPLYDVIAARDLADIDARSPVAATSC